MDLDNTSMRAWAADEAKGEKFRALRPRMVEWHRDSANLVRWNALTIPIPFQPYRMGTGPIIWCSYDREAHAVHIRKPGVMAEGVTARYVDQIAALLALGLVEAGE